MRDGYAFHNWGVVMMIPIVFIFIFLFWRGITYLSVASQCNLKLEEAQLCAQD